MLNAKNISKIYWPNNNQVEVKKGNMSYHQFRMIQLYLSGL